MNRTPLAPLVTESRSLIVARHPKTRAVLASARLAGAHRDDEWVGWWVKGGDMSDVVAVRLLARHMVIEFATQILAGRLPGCYGGALHCPTWREGTGPCVICQAPSWYTALAVAQALTAVGAS